MIDQSGPIPVNGLRTAEAIPPAQLIVAFSEHQTPKYLGAEAQDVPYGFCLAKD